MENNDPKPLKIAQKAVFLQTFRVHVSGYMPELRPKAGSDKQM